MARVTFVKKAQQRYETVPVLDDSGEPIRIPVMRKDGQQKVTKRGRPVFMTKTVEDRSKPKPLLRCDYCQKDIEIGTPYKHVSPKSGPYGGHKRARHAECPTWKIWEVSNSLSARLEQISFDATNRHFTDAEDVRDALREAAEAINEIADEKEESAQNIEDGFGHETYQSEELRQTADDLRSWSEDVESRVDDVEERPDEEVECPDCDGPAADASDDADEDLCSTCEGSGMIDNDDEISEWEGQVEDWLSIVDESPV